jgi:hypothetical protein
MALVLLAIIGIVFVSVGFAAAQGGLQEAEDLLAHPALLAMAIVVGVAFFFANYILAQYFMTYRIARHVVSTITITNLASVESILQSAEARPRYGEGLADAFDVGAV